MECLTMLFDRKSLALRGVIAVLFGLVAIILTQFVLDVLVYAFGFFAILNGILNAAAGSSSQKTEMPKWLLVITGLFGILIGIVALVAPLIIAMTITIFIAAWALVTGFSEIGLAVSHKALQHRVLLAISGIIGILFAIILVLTPVLGALALVMVLGIYALAFGIISIAVSISMGRESIVVEAKAG